MKLSTVHFCAVDDKIMCLFFLVQSQIHFRCTNNIFHYLYKYFFGAHCFHLLQQLLQNCKPNGNYLTLTFDQESVPLPGKLSAEPEGVDTGGEVDEPGQYHPQGGHRIRPGRLMCTFVDHISCSFAEIASGNF